MSNVVKIRKGNRILNVDESRLQSFLQQGYDQISNDGEVIKHATGGRSIPVAEYNKAIEEIEELKTENKKLKAENAKLKKGE
ncbi:hypothetical protein [Bacillus benzoevorans]|uniref:Uncharacterized protein n=1 Tax=Bacillus benzoevorans TaxID=1456 RepID=A0A7X0HTA3_9BACI|nr:hypothetical protein [Bacillus benzoevorans]MBB6446464.1 hypothetical protein [Bacillus benzoevorans]